MGYIYLRTNLINGKKYVGQAKDIKDRNYAWNNLSHHYAGKAIDAARAKYGIDAFDFEILKECKDEEMNQWEMYYVKEYNSKIPNGYNMTDGGDSTYEITDETRKKIGDALRGRKRPAEVGAKVAAALRGRKRSAEAVAKSAAAKRGKKRSEETKAKIAAAHRGMKHSEETKKKIAAAKRGKKLSEETKEKMSVAQKTSEKAKIGRTKVAAAKSKPVQALDKDGNVVMEFVSTREAQRQGFSSGHVAACCHNCYSTHKGNIYKGYVWRYAV